MLEKGDDTILLSGTALLRNSDSEFVNSYASEVKKKTWSLRQRC